MKKNIFNTNTILLFVFSFLSIFLNAQHSITSNYTSNYIGHDIDVNYNYKFKKSKFKLGLSFLLNRQWQNNPNWEVYYKVFHAFKVEDMIGYKIGYDYLFPLKNEKTTLFISYDLRYRYGQTRSLLPIFINDTIYNSKNIVLLKEVVSTKIHAFSNIIGVGLNTRIFNNVFLNMKGGVGFDTFYTTRNRHSRTSSFFAGNLPPLRLFNLSYLFSIGLEYKFIKKRFTN